VTPKERKALFKLLDESLKACLKVRETEGQGLLKDIQKQIKSLSQQTQKIQKLRGQALKSLTKKYHQRIEKLAADFKTDEQRLAQEIVIQIDKSDINEEIQRLNAHLKAIQALVVTSGPIGKKMDFYAQELLREVNTIGSKSTSSELTQVVVDAKGFVEKYREQVQNVE
ncbi:MAG: DUF1732 domain-containing protein, partial [Pseudomonadota bacterium]